jgi:hypothetical protein
VGILVATDAISEGINLQHAASQVVHYELPWNPNRLEQRNGRVDRFGQRKPVVYVRTMVMDETLDATILKVLVEKAAQIRQDYGFSPPYFGDDTDILDLIRQHDMRLRPKQLTLFDAWAAREPAVGARDAAQTKDPFSDETLGRIRDESFYGQTHITLPEIERRLRETSETVGSPEEIRRFVLSGLDRFGCRVEENADGTLQITLGDPALQTASVGGVIEQATFDPALGIDDPDVTVLDIGHPLVRKLIEAVKQATFRHERAGHAHDVGYGRTAYLITPDVERVTALFHLLVRYAVATEPASIIEELLPAAAPIYGGAPLDAVTARRLIDATPAPGSRTDSEVQESLTDALAIDGLDDLLKGAVESRRAELVAERLAMRDTLAAQGEGQIPAWLRGIADVAAGSYDLLAMTVLYPR